MLIATHPALVAGGSTIWMRSPEGREAEGRGDSSSTRWRVVFATSFASLRHQSKSANGSASRRQPSRVSRKATPGRLMQRSVTSLLESNGRSERSVSSSAEVEAATSASFGLEFIDGAEVKIAGDQDLDAIALG